MTSKEDMSILEKHVNQLAEYFDSVQIFCTRHEDGNVGTVYATSGTGNFAARRGQIMEWHLKQNEYVRKQVQNEDIDEL